MCTNLAKREDVIRDEAMRQANIMYFTETFLRSIQHIEQDYTYTCKMSACFQIASSAD